MVGPGSWHDYSKDVNGRGEEILFIDWLIKWLIGQEGMSTGSSRQKLVRKQSKVLSSSKSQWYAYIIIIYTPSVSKGKLRWPIVRKYTKKLKQKREVT